jgi:hypothetical protein
LQIFIPADVPKVCILISYRLVVTGAFRYAKGPK